MACEVRFEAAKCWPSGLSQAPSRGAPFKRMGGGRKVKPVSSLRAGHCQSPPPPVVHRLPSGAKETHRQNPAGKVATFVKENQSHRSSSFPVETTNCCPSGLKSRP